MLHSLHATISPLVFKPAQYRIPCQAITLSSHNISPFSGTFLFIGGKNIYFYGNPPPPPGILNPDNIPRSLYHCVSEGRGDRPSPLISIYIPVISTQLSVGVPSSHCFADFLPR